MVEGPFGVSFVDQLAFVEVGHTGPFHQAPSFQASFVADVTSRQNAVAGVEVELAAQ